ncbi:MAG: type II toxin-antitoxin system RelE/ParE family toxin [Ignavibacteria bacterium]|nr:type II toxin-antitoxin system RelE/ParE family toxin [Ignavibacteria bacterium]
MHRVRISAQAIKELNKLNQSDFHKIDDKILSLELNPKPMGCIKLQGANAYRVRVGDYRILYEVDEQNKVVDVFKVKHRKDVYRKK